MIKPQITRLWKDTHFPQKEHYSNEDLLKFFVNTEIIVMEKYDGKAFYDSLTGVFLEDLNEKNHHRKHIVGYYGATQVLCAIQLNDKKFYPAVSEYYDTFIASRMIDYRRRYGNITIPQVLFNGRVKKYMDLVYLIEILAGQRSSLNSNRDGRMEGIVLYSKEYGVWGKYHNEWFSYELSQVEN